MQDKIIMHILTYILDFYLASQLKPLTLIGESFGRIIISIIVHERKGGQKTCQLELKVLVGK